MKRLKFGCKFPSKWLSFQSQSTAFGDMLLMFVMGTMFLVLPAFWMTALTWAGLHAGAIAQALINGTKDAQTAGSKGGGALIKAGGRK